jgi:hypothetical protein
MPIQNVDKLVPVPAGDLEEGEVGLPELANGGLVLELVRRQRW